MKRTIIAGIAGLLSFNASAAAPSWDFIKAGYVQIDIEEAGDFEPKGFELQGFKAIGENFYLTGSYSQLSEDEYDVEVDLDSLSIGGGYRYGITQSTDVFTEITYEYENVEVDYGYFSDDEDDNGFGVAVGVRSMVTDSLELRGAVRYIDIVEDDTELEFGADYFFSPQFALGATYVFADDADLLGISVRYNF